MPKYHIFDNGGESLDRYTIIDKSGDMLGLSETGAGFSQFAGNCIDNYMNVSFGYSWRRQCDVNKVIKHELPRIINEFKADGHIGKNITFASLPKELQQHIKERFEQ
jgi:hypothetical protein